MDAFEVLYSNYMEVLEQCTSGTDQVMLTVLRGVAPVDSGRLRQSITARQVEPLAWEVRTSVDYGAMQNQGAGPYTILPKNKQALFWRGAAHPVKKVEHPGYRRHVGWWDTALDGVDLFRGCQ